MELPPRSPRSIQECTSSSSSEIQPFINLDDRRSLQVQDEISALEQQQQLYDCEKEKIRLQNKIPVLMDLVDNSGMRLQRLEDGTTMNATQLRTCLQEKENKEREGAELEDVAKAMKKQLERFETVERLQKEQMARLSAELESLQNDNTSVSIKLHRADLDAKALSKEIEHLRMQLLEESDCLLPIEKRHISPES